MNAVSVIIFTLNEELNLPHCLASLEPWCEDVIVVDSGSSDKTLEICREKNVRALQHRFTGFGDQRNWAIDNVQTINDWILILDADERLSTQLQREIQQRVAAAGTDVGAFRVRRRFYMWGRWLKFSNLYPTWVVRLIHKKKVRYSNRGHAETQTVNGKILDLTNDLIDENHKSMDHWFERQIRYAGQEAEYELRQAHTPLNSGHLFSSDPLQRRVAAKRLMWRLPLRPVWYFLYSYIFRAGFLEGRDGYIFCMMRAVYQAMIVAKKHDLNRTGRS